MNIAIIPWDESLIKDIIFIPKSADYLDSHILLRKAFLDRGHDIHTIDMYEDIEEVDCFLFFTLNYYWLHKLVKMGFENRMVYCSSEPDVVKPINSKKGYKRLLDIFPYIMTWNEDLVDNKRIFKRNIPYYFTKHFGYKNFKDRKLLVNMSSNKFSKQPKELYSERERIITFFERNYPDEFALYGPGWDKKKHPSYRGLAADKDKVYGDYKFALSLENTYGVKGYITEKIFDCFTSGIVPIYKGADNITDFVPKDCFIDYSEFNSLQELARYLTDMDEIKYNKYLNNISKLLDTDISVPFSSDTLCENIIYMLEKGHYNINVKFFVYLGILFRYWIECASGKWILLKKKLKKILVGKWANYANEKKGN